MEVVALINNIIGLYDACARIAKRWEKARDLPEAFRVIQKHIPLTNEILAKARDIYDVDKGSSDSKKICGVLEECHQKATSLKLLFDKVCPDDEDGRLDRYKRTLDNVIRNRQAKVEKLWEEMLKSIQLLGDFHVFKRLQPRQVLKECLEEIQGVLDSLPDSEGSRVNIGTISGKGTGVFAGDGNVETYAAWGQYGNVAKEMRIYQAPASDHWRSHTLYAIPFDPLSSDRASNHTNAAFAGASSATTEYSDCAHAFYLTNPQDNLDYSLSRIGIRAQGSCEWFLADREFAEWCTSATPQVLLATGEPGIGKTVIATFVVEHLRKQFRNSGVPVLWYFCNHADPDQRSAVAVVRGILRQLLERRRALFEYLKGPYDDVGDKLFSDFGRLWKILIKVLDVQPSPIFIIIDALDEYEQSCQDKILQALHRLHEEFLSDHCLKILLFARAAKKVMPMASSCTGFRYTQITRAKIKDDLSAFIEREIKSISQDWSPSRTDAVTSIISNKNGGTFLWVSLVFKSIVDVPPGQLEDVIDKMPDHLLDLYRELIKSVKFDDSRTARDALHFVLAAKRPLTVTQLGLLLYFRHKRKPKKPTFPDAHELDRYKDAYKACGALLRTEVDRVGSTIVLPIHQTVKDYLTGPDLPRELAEYRFDARKVLKLLKDACIIMLHVPELKQITDDMKKVWRDCARREWFSVQNGTGHPQVLERRQLPLLARGRPQAPSRLPKNLPDDWWDGWKLLPYTLTDHSGSWRTLRTGYRWLGILDLRSVALAHVGKGPQYIRNVFKPALDALRKTMHVAIEQGNVPVLLILLSFMAEMSAEDAHSRATNLEALLVAAILAGQLTAAEALLERIDFFEAIQKRHRHVTHDTADACEVVGRTLTWAIKSATDLVSVDIPVAMRDNDLVGRAIAKMSEFAVDLLHVINKDGLDKRQKAVMELLVEKGRAYLEHAGKRPDLMLHYAASCGACDLVDHYLQHYRDKSTTIDHEGKTSLHHAAIGDHVDIAAVLIRAFRSEHSSSPAPKGPWLMSDNSGNLPLHYACKNGSSAMAKILVEADEGRESIQAHNMLNLRPEEVAEDLYVTLDTAMDNMRVANTKNPFASFQRGTSCRRRECHKTLRYLSNLPGSPTDTNHSAFSTDRDDAVKDDRSFEAE